MERMGFYMYDEYPPAMLNYLKHYGYHFNKKAYEFAVSRMKARTGAKISPLTKDQYDEFMKRYGVQVEHDQMCDGMYVWCMGRSDLYQSSVIDDHHLALYVKDVVDDVDAEEGSIFYAWYAKMVHSGIAIEWEDLM